MKYKTHTRKYAEEQGFVAVTSGYLPKEYPLLDAALVNLKGIFYLLVDEGGKKVAIYRRKSELKLDIDR
jgi:hypothetical protein